MNTLLSLLLLLPPLVTQTQAPPARPDGSPLDILDAEVTPYALRPSGTSLPAPPPGPVSVNDLPGRGNNARRDQRESIPGRATELHEAESRAQRSASVNGSSSGFRYEYRLKVRNVGSKKVTSLLWEFRVVDAPVADASRRLFLCSEELKPGESRRLRVWTPMAPVGVVSADGAGGPAPKAEAVINRVEYDDGSAWQRAGWEPGETQSGNPRGAGHKLRRGECAVL